MGLSMALSDITSMGGERCGFITTSWRDLRKIKSNDKELKRFIVGNLLGQYWKPVYCYIRHKGYDNNVAKDLTQKFFHEIVLEGELAEKADESKGRFRTFLLRCLDHFLANEYQRRMARKRMPAGSLIQFSQFDADEAIIVDDTDSPEAAFHRAWVHQIIEEVLTRLEDGCLANGQKKHWEAFRRRILLPIMYDEPVPSLHELCSELSIGDESRASNMIITVKRRFRRILADVLARHSKNNCSLEIESLMEELLQK
jgi:RNA polymerase sigma-70 factor (ECF subfamily)